MKFTRHLNIKARGQIMVERRNIASGKIDKWEMHNLICTNFAAKFISGTNNAFLSSWSDGYTSAAGLACGDGSAEPSAADTALTHQLFTVACSSADGVISADCRTCSLTIVFDLPATASYVGNLTECGLLAEGTLVTHSLFEDAEGNPITIAKTDLDEIIITYVIHISSYGKSGACGIINNGGVPCLSGRYSSSWSWGDNSAGLKLSMRKFHLSYDAEYVYSQLEFWADFCAVVGSGDKLPFPLTRFIQNHAYNGHFVQCLLAIGHAGRGWMPLDAVLLPDTDVMLLATLEDYSVGTGDGSTTDFRPPIPAWLEDTEVVYVDGIAQVRNVDYTCDPAHNLQFNPELFPLFHANIIGGYIGTPGAPYVSVIWMTDNGTKVNRINSDNNNSRLVGYASRRNAVWNRTQICMDNNHPFIVEIQDSDALIRRDVDEIWLFTYYYTSAQDANNYDEVTLEASNDLTNWVTILDHVTGRNPTRTANTPYGQALDVGWVKYTLPTPADYKYWRISNHMGGTANHDNFGLIMKHAGAPIHFVNAPRNEAVITMDCQIDRMWKDDKHVADITVTYTV